MTIESKTELAATLSDQIQSDLVIRIIKRWSKKFRIDWEDLRQQVMIKFLERIDRPDESSIIPKCRGKHLPHLFEGINDPERWQRSAIVCRVIRNCAIDMSRREPAGKLRRIGERHRSASRVGGNQANAPRTKIVFAIDSLQVSTEILRTDKATPRFIVEDAFGVLPVPSQQILRLRFFEGLSFPEIAARMERSLEQIKSRWRSDIEEIRPSIVKGWL